MACSLRSRSHKADSERVGKGHFSRFFVFILAGIHEGEMSDTRPRKRTMPSLVNDISSVCYNQVIKIS